MTRARTERGEEGRRGRAEEALRRSEELHRRVLESVPAGIVTVAPDGSMVQANAIAQRILGLGWDKLAQRYVSDFAGETIHEDGRPFLVEEYPVSKCLRTGQPQPAVTMGVRRPDGQVSWAMYSAVPIRDVKTGELTGSVVTFVDITERKRSEEGLRQSEELHRAIAELTSDYAYVCRVEADGTARLVSATGGFTRVTGYTLAETEARGGWTSFMHPEDLPGILAKTADLLAGRQAIQEARIITKGGAVRWIRYSTLPVHDPALGRVARLIGAVQDVTESKRAEEKLREGAAQLRVLSARVLDAQEDERRHIAQELHDEIGQSLTGLKLSLEMVARLPPGQVAALLAEARGLVNQLIGQVRKLSLDLRPAMLDDLGLLPALVWLLQRYTAQTSVRVEFEHHGLEQRFPPATETAAYRIVQEALTNVARHAGVDQAAVRMWRDQGMLYVQVEDRGAGFVPEAVLAARLSSGLVGMRERAHGLGGRLLVEARPGGGTRLTAELPAAGADQRSDHDRDVHAGR